MASRVVEEEDLIDLEDAAGSLSRVSSLSSGGSGQAEELEHLLDVCPPQLEKKLSLTRKQESVPESREGNDVLVTLGHDKLVPRQKRIDVVSSETIKRIRDITKNLEPVIRSCENPTIRSDEPERRNGEGDRVDAPVSKENGENADYETQTINSAFDFLSELEDVEEDDQPPDKKRRIDSRYDEANSPASSPRYPLEPTCLIIRSRSPLDYRELDRSNRQIEATDRTFVLDKDDDDRFALVENHENPAFDVSPASKSNDRQISQEQVSSGASFANGFAKLSRLFNEAPTSEIRDENERRNECRLERKSWTEGESRRYLPQCEQDSNCFERSTSIDIDRFNEPSTSKGITAILRRSARNVFRNGPMDSASSSECSEVDWSWVAEYESQGTSKTSDRIGEQKNGSAVEKWRKKEDNRIEARPSSAPTRLTKGSCGPEGGGESAGTGGEATSEAARRAGSSLARESSASAAMSVLGTGKFSATSGHSPAPEASTETGDDRISSLSTSYFELGPSEPRIVNENSWLSGSFGYPIDSEHARDLRNSRNAGNGNADGRGRVAAAPSSWLRASMRRIRRLRLPDATSDRRIASDSMLTNVSLIGSGPNSLPDIALVAPEILAAQTNSSNSSRPSSAPAHTREDNGPAPSPRRGRRHEARARALRTQERNSRLSAPRSLNNNTCESTDIPPQTSVPTSPHNRRVNSASNQHPAGPPSNPARRICERQREADRDNERGGGGDDDDDDEDENPLGRWPHPLSPALACLGCTLGLFNISRFAILSIQFGANFIVQFLVLTLVLGIPLLTLQVCLGQRLSAGAVDMWRISPIFHGVGIALLVAQAFIGIYSIIGVSWMFIYFRDSFITKQDRYRWAEPFLLYRDEMRMVHNATSYKLHETVPDYFSGVVLQRHHLHEPDPGVVTLKFQVAFNLAVVWMIVFVSLSKGLRSYGKVVYVFTLVPVFGTLVLCTKLLGLTPPGSIHQLFPATVWREFFINSKSWIAASSEVFLTWGLLGAAAMQVAAHNKHKHLLQRDTSLVVVLTLVVLLLSAFLANTCVQILRHYGYIYTTSSFERISGYTFMRNVNQPAPSGYSNTPERFMSHASFLLGQRVVRPGADLGTESGYQALRLSTELVPATLAILGTEQVSPFWAVLFYFILILFGIAQQLAIWHCVITGIMAINTKMMKLWETTITFFSCACAYILGLPIATELGIYVVYYLDYTIGGAWWIMILYLVQVGAVFAVRGRPHTGETVVAELFPPTGRCLRHWAGPLLSFTWNVVLPVALMVLSITIFKNSNFRDLYVYRRTSRDYWSVWARQLGAAIQLTPILIIPGVAIIQTCRYLNSGPPDIFDRIQLLYRPPLDTEESTSSPVTYGNETSTSIHGNGILAASNEPPFEDPPPKYTPPPSYTTATGARIAKMLRQSFRRSVRRIASVLGESSAPRTRPALQPPPPDYATVLVEMNQSGLSEERSIRDVVRPDVTDTRSSLQHTYHDRHRPRTIDRMTRISTIDRGSVERTHSTMDRARSRVHNNVGSSNFTAADVANLLRSSIRRAATRTQTNLCSNSMGDSHTLTTTIPDTSATTTAASVENLVNAAVPINEDVCDKDMPLVHNQLENDDDDEEKKTVNEMDNSVSVI